MGFRCEVTLEDLACARSEVWDYEVIYIGTGLSCGMVKEAYSEFFDWIVSRVDDEGMTVEIER